MNCDNANRRIAEYVFDELDRKTAGEVSAHLEECAACREVADDMRRVAGLLRAACEAEEAPSLGPERRQALFAAANCPEEGQVGFSLRRSAKALGANRWVLRAAALLAVSVLAAALLWPSLSSPRVADAPPGAFDSVPPSPPSEPAARAEEEQAAYSIADALAEKRAGTDAPESTARSAREREARPLAGERLRERAAQPARRMEAVRPEADRPAAMARQRAEADIELRSVAPPPEPTGAGAPGQWQVTSAAPVSIFGLSHAAPPYILVRNAIQRGHFPPQAALRPDEMVGAFDEPRTLRDERPLAVETQAAPAPFDGGTTQLNINLQGSAVGPDAVVDVAFRPERVRRQRLVGQGIVGDRSAVAVYEIEADETELRDFGEVRVRRLNAETQEIEETVEPLPATAVQPLAPAEAPRFYLVACAAEFAEILRGDAEARAQALDRLIPVMEEVADALPDDGQAAELLDLLRRARELAEP